MPVEDFTDIDLGTSDKTFEELDKTAAKAQKSLEKRNKELQKTQKNLKQDVKIEKKLEKLKEKIKKDEVMQLGDKETLLDKILGKTQANNLISMAKNPTAFFTGIAKAIPFLGGVLAAKEIADFIVDEIVKIDRFLKVFIDEIDKRVDVFRTLQEQAEVQAGLTQRIITTSAGSVEPRYAYNTFEEFNTNQTALEERFQMTNNSGVE